MAVAAFVITRMFGKKVKKWFSFILAAVAFLPFLMIFLVGYLDISGVGSELRRYQCRFDQNNQGLPGTVDKHPPEHALRRIDWRVNRRCFGIFDRPQFQKLQILKMIAQKTSKKPIISSASQNHILSIGSLRYFSILEAWLSARGKSIIRSLMALSTWTRNSLVIKNSPYSREFIVRRRLSAYYTATSNSSGEDNIWSILDLARSTWT